MFPDRRVQPFRKALHQIGQVCGTHDLRKLLLGHMLTAICNIFPDGTRKQDGGLRHHCKMLSVCTEVYLAHVMSVKQDTALTCHVEADDHVQYCRLSGSRLTDKRNGLPLLHMQVQMVQNLIFIVAVVETHFLKIKHAIDIGHLFLALVVLHILREQDFPNRID